MSGWEVADLADDLKAVAAVEVGRLITVGAERQLSAAAPARLVHDRVEQAAPESVVASVLADPQVPDPSGATPGPSVETGQQGTVRVVDGCERIPPSPEAMSSSVTFSTLGESGALSRRSAAGGLLRAGCV